MMNRLHFSLGFCFLAMTTMASPVFTNPGTGWTDLKLSEFIKLSARGFEERTGYKMSLEKKISFRLLKSKMRKAARKSPGMTVGEFLTPGKKGGIGNAVLWILVGGLLVFFFLFLMLYTDDA